MSDEMTPLVNLVIVIVCSALNYSYLFVVNLEDQPILVVDSDTPYAGQIVFQLFWLTIRAVIAVALNVFDQQINPSQNFLLRLILDVIVPCRSHPEYSSHC